MLHDNTRVRDGIPALTAATGHQPNHVALDLPAVRASIEDRLAEELTEHRESRDHAELLNIVEVIQAIIACAGGDGQAPPAARKPGSAAGGTGLSLRLSRRLAALPTSEGRRHARRAGGLPDRATGARGDGGCRIDRNPEASGWIAPGWSRARPRAGVVAGQS